MKSQVSKPATHVSMPSHKNNHPAVPASAGTQENVKALSHEGDIALGEGLEYGAVHTSHKKHSVRDAKEVKGLQMAAQAAHERRENNNADPKGDCE